MKANLLTNILVWSVILSLVLVVGCEKDSPTVSISGDQAPSLPPLSSMQVDLKLFSDAGALAKATHTLTKHHWFNAAMRVTNVNAAVILSASVPTSVFAMATSQQPRLEEDGKFHWIYQAKNGNGHYSVDLVGWVDAKKNEIACEMYVSHTSYAPEVNKFLWYEGRQEQNGKNGYWIIYDDTQPGNNVKAVRIDWTIASGNDRSLVFTNMHKDTDYHGDVLTYLKKDSNIVMKFFDASENSTAVIEWNSETGAGYLADPDYNNGVKGYWDENKDDSDCLLSDNNF